MVDTIAQLAEDLDAFEYDYDYYGYMDAVDDRQQALEDPSLWRGTTAAG